MSTPRRRAGFSLIELLVAASLLVVVVLYATQSFTVQNRAYTVVDQVAEAQQNLRAVAALLEREVRRTAFLVPEAAAVCGVDLVSASDTIFVTDADAIDANVVSRDDLGAGILLGYSGSGTDDLSVSSTVLDGVASYDTDDNGVADSDFRVNGGAIVIDRANPDRGTACGVVQSVGANTVRVTYVPGAGTLGATAPGSTLPDLVVVPAHVYSTTGGTTFSRDGMPLARGVEDFQFALFYDVDEDGEVDSAALEYPGSDGGASYAPASWDNELLREIRLNLVTRSRDADPEFNGGRFQVLENRTDPGTGDDGFRRRVVTLRVRPRNVGHR